MRTLKAITKSIPGVTKAIIGVRAGRRKILLKSFNAFLRFAQRNYETRSIFFDALPDRYALALHPEESYLVNTSDKMIGKRLYYRGFFDIQKLETACDLIQTHTGLAQDAVLIDAGANVGSICIPAVRRGLVQRAIACELDPDNTRILRINALLNEVEDRIDIRNVAVGAAPGEVAVQHSASNFGDHRVCTSSSGQGVSVPMVSLDSIVDDLDLSRTILWMDIQGYEAFALQGARRLMEAGVPLISEFSREELDSTGSFDTFLSLVTDSRYAVFHDLNARQPEATPLSRAALEALSDRLMRQGNFTDLLFLPELNRQKT